MSFLVMNIDSLCTGSLLGYFAALLITLIVYACSVWFRHWPLYDSMKYSTYISGKLGVWLSAGAATKSHSSGRLEVGIVCLMCMIRIRRVGIVRVVKV